MKAVERFVYLAPNRRCERTVVETLLEFGESEMAAVRAGASDLLASLCSTLCVAGIIPEPGKFPALPDSDDARELFIHLFTHTALLLQQAAGHNVAFARCILEAEPSQSRALFEYEEKSVGEKAEELALATVSGLSPIIDWKSKEINTAKTPAELVNEFLRYAAPRAMPVDTRAIIEAAVAAGVPYQKLDRYPFEPASGDYRVRMHSALGLGHACHRHIVDGTFCVDRSRESSALIKDRLAGLSLLHRMGLPLPGGDPALRIFSSMNRAIRSARRIGYPLVIRRAFRGDSDTGAVHVSSELELRGSLQDELDSRSEFILEPYLEWQRYTILFANQQLIGVVRRTSGSAEFDGVAVTLHPSVAEAAHRVAAALDAGMVALSVLSRDINQPLTASETVFDDLEVAPELDSFLSADSTLLKEAAIGFVHWLFPPGSTARVPIVAVTGTNGKTTTSRMIHAILQRAGYAPGLACSDGLYDGDGQLIRAGDLAGGVGHCLLMNHTTINAAVLETARGAVAQFGIVFDRCDIGICLNVTPDHLEDKGINTLQEMAGLKRSIIERAREAVVINADSSLCLAMAPFPMAPKLCLVSAGQDIADLRKAHRDADLFALLETEGDKPWIVLYDRGERLQIVAADEVPATWSGLAQHNIYNALHAVAACYLMGVAPSVIAQGLSKFELNFETAPGRLNVYDGHPYRVLLDYAHNNDGIACLSSMIDRMHVDGRKIVAFSAASYNPDELIRGNAEALAGHYDVYICFNFGTNIEREHHHIPGMLRQALLEQGIDEQEIRVNATAMEAVDTVKALAKKGDLVVFLSGHSARKEIWERLTAHD